MNRTDPQTCFRLHPIRAAKVSEISEMTAASASAPEDRVNFHIGNPVQDTRLFSAYLRMVTGIDIKSNEYTTGTIDAIAETLALHDIDRPLLELLKNLIINSAPYTPRGGFHRSKPIPLVRLFSDWLLHQQDPLSYDPGESSGQREIILGSGGVHEALRVLLQALSSFLVKTPAEILLYSIDVPPHLRQMNNLLVTSLPPSEKHAIQQIEQRCNASPETPVFLLLGSVGSEEMRRELRLISTSNPLFFIEVNNAPNHRSLAREAKLMDRVLRILTPDIFSPHLANLSTTFIVGNADYLNVIETVHFQLKGTPSASEIELLTFLLQHRDRLPVSTSAQQIDIEPPYDGLAFGLHAEQTLQALSQRVEDRLTRLLQPAGDRIEQAASSVARTAESLTTRLRALQSLPAHDSFAAMNAFELVNTFISAHQTTEWLNELEKNFLTVFIKHHPEYHLQCCVTASGSSRTALSLIGFHCGITDVIIPDLSWTYEHCFPHVHTIPLTPDFEMDIDGMIAAVERRLADDPAWQKYGAVVLNNPHNATGRVFSESEIRRLILWLLGHSVTIIDDLSYQNVAPDSHFTEIKTIRQITDEFVRQGALTAEQAAKVITVHSLSKTDCLAGARLSVVEIREQELLETYRSISRSIVPNTGAILLTYLFYRNTRETARAYWRLRNQIFLERMEAIQEAAQSLPQERNPYAIHIIPPTGSMYPLMMIDQFPSGISLDWIAAGLARQGIGMVPLSTFARTEKGFETARKTFRLTLGGTDGAEQLSRKTRRVLIDLNRLIGEESNGYNRRTFPAAILQPADSTAAAAVWNILEQEIRNYSRLLAHSPPSQFEAAGAGVEESLRFNEHYLPGRLELFRQRFHDRSLLTNALIRSHQSNRGKELAKQLETEFYKDTLARRTSAFRRRLYDRTVHPTQMYSIQSEAVFDSIIAHALRQQPVPPSLLKRAAQELYREHLGLNVAIPSSDEALELLLDLDALTMTELFAEFSHEQHVSTFLSFWGDWDGSNRPSGQGHRLVSAVLIENVKRLSRLLKMLVTLGGGEKIPPGLLLEIEQLPEYNRKSTELFHTITTLTHQLESRYRGILPLRTDTGSFRRLGMSLRVVRDPLTAQWRHNDRLERKMLDLRSQRRKTLSYYFSLNKRLRKQLHGMLPSLIQLLNNRPVALELSLYRDLLQRFVITPRIHQKMIVAQDQFAIDTTVHNITELNELGGASGNPGMVLALQVSMATKAEHFVTLHRKIEAKRDHILREKPEVDLPAPWIIPLFEDIDAVRGIPQYLNKVWDYALQSRRMNQSPPDRLKELTTELFIAGSDLSQQIGQSPGAACFRQAKHELMLWAAEHNLAGELRVKMGCGEPMQRQGGYYAAVSGMPAFIPSEESKQRLAHGVRASIRKSTEYAATPLLGTFASQDLRTFQSTLSEQLRFLPLTESTQLLYHVGMTQQLHLRDLLRASEELVETRLQFRERGEQELRRLTIGTSEQIFGEFLPVVTENFRQILYGREDDVVGIHMISYFIARTIPSLRDRPTIRASQDSGGAKGERILQRIAETIPLSRYGSMLRAIAHNQAQTMLLGINQLTTGLFRALTLFAGKQDRGGDRLTLIADKILPHLPVYEILQSQRLYQDPELRYLTRLERAYPAGNSALLALREDLDAFSSYCTLFQQELLRRHGLDVTDFFRGDIFNPRLLPTLRPDLAVLLQPDLFNTDVRSLAQRIGGSIPTPWLQEMEQLLTIPVEIRRWRAKAWNLLEQPVFERLRSFVELAIALNSLSPQMTGRQLSAAKRELKIPSRLSEFFKSSRTDDDMRQFLAAAVEYLAVASEGMIELPITIIRALNDVERIARIEEQALLPDQQDLLRFYLLQMARIAGENG